MRTSLRFVVLATVLSSVGAAAAQEQHDEFGYTGTHGPAKWGQTHGWEACAGGSAGRQSPVAIRHATVDKTLASIQLDTHETAVALINNGHTIEQEYGPGSVVTFGGVRYELAQFHFHSPSEHTIAGRHAALELHAVFTDPGTKKNVVIAQLFTVGQSSPFLATLIGGGLPAHSGDRSLAGPHINVSDAFADLAHYYTYAGSLTTPPCSETVTWLVLEKEQPLSQAQADAFHHALGSNARPVQPLNQRVVRATAAPTPARH